MVGAVINTIDDQLRKGDFAARHRIDDLGLLPGCSKPPDPRSNRDSHRDHGHVRAQPADGGAGNFQGGGDGGERWRNADRPAGDTEVVLRGPRVLVGGDGGVLAPWDYDFPLRREKPAATTAAPPPKKCWSRWLCSAPPASNRQPGGSPAWYRHRIGGTCVCGPPQGSTPPSRCHHRCRRHRRLDRGAAPRPATTRSPVCSYRHRITRR